MSSNPLSSHFLAFCFYQVLVFSLKKKNHSVILSFIHAFIHLFRQAVKLTYTHTQSPIQYTCRISSAEPTTYMPNQKLKNMGLGGVRNHKALIISVVSPTGLFILHTLPSFLPSVLPSFLAHLLTYLLTYL